MKKMIMGAALVTMIMVGCTNEDLIERNESQLFTLEVGKGIDSRTYLDGNQLVWSENDKIYVTSTDGKVNGVLKLVAGAGTPNGKFQGTVNGNTEKLKNIVYPANVNGMSMRVADVNELVAPMTGTIGGQQGNALTFNCGFVKLNVLGLDNNDEVNISGGSIGTTLRYDVASNSWLPVETGEEIRIKNVEDATSFIVPVYTTDEDPGATTTLNVSVIKDGQKGGSTPVEVSVVTGKVDEETPILAVADNGDVVDPSNPEAGSNLGNGYIYVTTKMNLLNVIQGPLEIGDDKYSDGVKDGAYIILAKGEHVVSTFFTIKNKSLTIVGEDGAKIVDTLKEAWNAKTINTWGNYLDGRKELSLVIKNVEFENRNGNNTNLWLRTNDNETAESENDKNNGYIFNVELENVTMSDILYDNYYNDGTVINLDIKNCDIKRIVLQAYNRELMKTYTSVTFDGESNVGIYVDGELLGDGVTHKYYPGHMTVNGVTQKDYGCVVEYKE